MSSREGSRLWNHSLWRVMCFVQLESNKHIWESFAFPCIAENIWNFGNISLSLTLWHYLLDLNFFTISFAFFLQSFMHCLGIPQWKQSLLHFGWNCVDNVPSRLVDWAWLYFPFTYSIFVYGIFQGVFTLAVRDSSVESPNTKLIV